MSAAVDLLLFQLRAVKAPDPHLEYPFAKEIGRRFRFDVAWPKQRVALECDGGAFISGRHATGTGIRSDCEKFSLAAGLGWRVLRVLPEQIESGQALEWVQAALAWREAA